MSDISDSESISFDENIGMLKSCYEKLGETIKQIEENACRETEKEEETLESKILLLENCCKYVKKNIKSIHLNNKQLKCHNKINKKTTDFNGHLNDSSKSNEDADESTDLSQTVENVEKSKTEKKNKKNKKISELKNVEGTNEDDRDTDKHNTDNEEILINNTSEDTEETSLKENKSEERKNVQKIEHKSINDNTFNNKLKINNKNEDSIQSDKSKNNSDNLEVSNGIKDDENHITIETPKKPLIRLVPTFKLLSNPPTETNNTNESTESDMRTKSIDSDSVSEDNEPLLKTKDSTKDVKVTSKPKSKETNSKTGINSNKEILSKHFKKSVQVRLKRCDLKNLMLNKSIKPTKENSEELNKDINKSNTGIESEEEIMKSSIKRHRKNKKATVESSDESEKETATRSEAIDENDSDSKVNSDNNSEVDESSDTSVEILPKKRRGRIVKPKDSSDEEINEDSDPGANNSCKRKRQMKTSDSSGDDGDENSKNKRKNIRKLIKTKDLEDVTKIATKEEEERKRRIEERQRKYNEIYEKPESIKLSELVLDFDEETQKPIIEVDKNLLKQLKPHQATGVKFMWDACFETVKDCNEKPGSGCILAHCMGLGKTLQIITLTHTLITNSSLTGIERALIISPLSTLNNWAREFHSWMKFCKNRNIEVYDMSRFKDKNTRIFKLNEWYEEGGACIMGYDMYRILSNEKAKGLKKKQREILQKSLVDPGPDIVACDEGHLLKNEKTSLSKAVTKMRTKRRIVLTGTPLQNNLKEYYCMIQFIKPNLLGTYKEYLNRFVNPITNGQYADSTDRDMRLMKHRSHILHTLLEGCIQRRDYSVLAPYLPPKHEYVVYIQCSEIQRTVYEYYMTKQRDIFLDAQKGAKLFQDFQNLRRIWTHPMCLRVNSDTVIKKKLMRDTDSEGSLKDFIDDDDETGSEDEYNSNSSCDDKSEASSNDKKKHKTRSIIKEESDIEEVVKEDESEWWIKLVPANELDNIYNSPKLVILMNLLRECEAIGDKILVFSQSLQSLDVIEHFLNLIDRKTRDEEDIEGDVGDFRGFWQPNVDYFRLDGSRSVDNREAMCKVFNDKRNVQARLFLISTRAGGLGINLVAANRVVIFDVSWNPSHDTQSIFRVYRFGQDKPCYIYRLIAMGMMEQKVYERQVIKQATAKRVIDEQQISRHYNQNDLQELYSYELVPSANREIPILPKDKLFAELLSNHDKLIFKYHEHDSLLENEVSEHLTEDERKAAWSEYEAEKTRPTITASQYIGYNRQAYGQFGQPSGGPVTANKIFGFRTDVLLQLLNLKVQADNPGLRSEQVVLLVPGYLQKFYAEMNSGDPTMYKELLDLHQQLEVPYMNPLLYANQNPMAASSSSNYRNVPGVAGTSDTIEILDD